MPQRLAIIGAGDLGQHLAHYAITDGHYQLAGFFDDFRPPFERVSDAPVLGTTADVETLYRRGAFDVLMIGIGYHHLGLRRALFERYAGTVPMGRVIHSTCFVDPSCYVAPGSALFPGCILDCRASLRENVVLQSGSFVAHDAVIGAHSFLSARVAVAGKAQVGESCYLGISTTVIDSIRIGANIQTGAGTVVIRDLVEPGLYVGNPARFIR